ncbi:ABC transporter permease [Deinococcus sonorensis]|uniref:ABC transporter permease n=2 Tax=Deinococcus sonorensis TaxID=309891 RepID=A0AAU7U9V6_9DEIO
MTTRTLTAQPAAARPLQMWAALTGAELRRFLRNPLQAMATIFFPLFFFALFGLSASKATIEGVNGGVYVYISFATYSLMSTALFTFGVSVANERASGWLRLLKITPLGAAQHLAAKFALALIVGLCSLLLLLAFAVVAGGVHIAPGLAAGLIGRLLLGSVCFVALGFVLGFALSVTSVTPVVNILWLALSFGSGLFVPLSNLPVFIQRLSPWLPSSHLARIGWRAAGVPLGGSEAVDWLWLAGYTLVFLVLGRLAYRRDSARQYG